MSKYHGRKKPYTKLGLSRINCYRCPYKARYQWNSCANGNRWVPVCKSCDLLLNELFLQFFRVANGKQLMADYTKRVLLEHP